jgi:hypothetical protein
LQIHRGERRFLFFLGGGTGVSALLQKSAICLALFVIMVVAWRFASAVARLRAEPATALAPLNHMLSHGFFLVQGFFICCLRFQKHAGKMTAAASNIELDKQPSEHSLESARTRMNLRRIKRLFLQSHNRRHARSSGSPQ